MFCYKVKSEKSKKKGRKQDLKSSISEEEAKKTAVIDCLSALSEEVRTLVFGVNMSSHKYQHQAFQQRTYRIYYFNFIMQSMCVP